MDSIELKDVEKLAQMIQDINLGLDTEVLAHWYAAVKQEARSLAPPELADTIDVVQDPILPMKFHLKTSKRVVHFLLEAIENNLGEMPYATRLYFQKLEEIIEKEFTETILKEKSA